METFFYGYFYALLIWFIASISVYAYIYFTKIQSVSRILISLRSVYFSFPVILGIVFYTPDVELEFLPSNPTLLFDRKVEPPLVEPSQLYHYLLCIIVLFMLIHDICFG